MLNRDFSYTALFHPPLQRLVLYLLDWIHQEVNHTNKKKGRVTNNFQVCSLRGNYL